jgi:hypothetical protein
MSVVQSGQKFQFSNVTGTYDKLPVGNYLLKYDQREGFYLIKKEDFILPKKVYGDHSIVHRWLKSWDNNSTKNMGILLKGVKGSGKTITAQLFCVESNLPVIIINEHFSDSDFVDFLTNPELGECIIFIDEFEKTFKNNDQQQELLSLMDGNYSTNLIFLLTVNEDRLTDYMVNRLNRIKYCKSYDDLDFEVMEQVIEDLLVNKSHKQSIYQFFDKVNIRTFDLLVNLIKEMNLFNEDANVCGGHLNLKPEIRTYEVYEIINNKEFPCYSSKWPPNSQTIDIDRREIGYLPFKTNRSKEDFEIERENIAFGLLPAKKPTDDEISEYWDWSVELPTEECTIERKGKSFVVEHPKSGLKFRFKEEPKYNLVF